jgi:hypothetical protein
MRMRKNDERKRRSFRTEGKRLEMARSNVGSYLGQRDSDERADAMAVIPE